MEFEANLAIFENFNPGLEEALRTISVDQSEYFEEDPQKEAELWFYSLESLENLSTLVIFGIGLGYYYDAVKEWLHKDSSRYLIFLESDLRLLRLFLHTQKASEILNDPQVVVLAIEIPANGIIQIENCGWKWVAKLLLNGPSLFTALHKYKKNYSKFWEQLKQALHYYVRALSWECSFFLPDFVRSCQSNTARNLFQLSGSRLFYDLQNKFKGIPAIICGAGPSIEAELPILKLYEDRALIFGAGTGMNVLNAFNITAHFGVGIDPDIASASRMMSNRAYETPYCFTLKFNHEALNWIHGTKLYFRGQDLYGIDSWFEKALSLDQWPRIDYRVSTTYACLLIAQMMGCNPLILLGVDLAYTDQKKYPGQITSHPCDRLDISWQQLGGPHPQERIDFIGEGGEVGATRADWIREAQEYGLFSHEHPGVQIINATAKGFPVPGLKKEPFQVVAQKYLQKNQEVEKRLIEAIAQSRILEHSVSDIREKITLWLEKLKEGEEWLKKLENGERKEWETFANKEVYRYFLQTIDHYYETFFFDEYFRYKYRSKTWTEQEKFEKKRSFEKGRIQYLNAYLSLVKKLYELHLNTEVTPSIAENPDPVKKGNACYYYYLNGQLKSHLPYTNEGILEGCAMLYYPDGLPKREIHFKKGVLEGTEKFWDAKGNLIFECEHPQSPFQGTLKQIKKILESHE